MSARDTLRPFLDAGLIETLQLLFVEALERIGKESLDEAARIAMAFASVAPAHGHVAAHIESLPKLIRLECDEEKARAIAKLPWPSPTRIREALSKSVAVRSPEEDRATPLVLDGSRLYLDRYFLDEKLVLEAISKRLEPNPELSEGEARELRAIVDRLFSAPGRQAPEQKQAVATALLRKLTIVTGGPGTGKTTTVVRLLGALLERAKGDLRIELMAPTGKAAARMAESIRAQRKDLALVCGHADKIPDGAKTLHRALGVIFDKPGRFRHDANNPLPIDVAVVDEASMIDLPMMARLFEALPETSHLILLGDRDQLASVDAGAVLGDLCGDARDKKLSPDFVAELGKIIDIPDGLVAKGKVPAIADAVVELRHSFRFDGDKGIGRLAKAINEGSPDRAMQALSQGSEVEHVKVGANEPIPGELRRRIVHAFQEAIEAGHRGDAKEALANIGRMRVLSAHRRGARGVEGLNRLIVNWLAEAKVVEPKSAFFHGRLVMVTENDYGVGLFNGDIGLVLRENGNGPLRVHFEDAKNEEGHGLKVLAPTSLPAHETAFAMTIHKSQGSEFDHVVVVLPDERSPIVTRELVYTGITRAKKKATLVGSEEVIRDAVLDRVQRQSGLGEWLWR